MQNSYTVITETLIAHWNLQMFPLFLSPYNWGYQELDKTSNCDGIQRRIQGLLLNNRELYEIIYMIHVIVEWQMAT